MMISYTFYAINVFIVFFTILSQFFEIQLYILSNEKCLDEFQFLLKHMQFLNPLNFITTLKVSITMVFILRIQLWEIYYD